MIWRTDGFIGVIGTELADAANSIQLQRGLSAVNLATPSIGGTMNIITDPKRQTREVVSLNKRVVQVIS